ncbi:MAG TPA: UTP--glucose-1-phosphate uridylyltransferase [Kofleriaceae bacterium]|jgi:UTP--glucose-1-phosphate uridylyltransferase|nr:UTP--glucose-1-phosphate uridylyltransferase [Kofleriaceae bacterium]
MTMRSSVRKAVIPAAGLGTRFLPATKAVPKEMLPIVDVPTIQLVIDEAVRAGVTDVIVVNGRGKHAIEDHFDHAYELEHTLRERGNARLADEMTAVSQLVRLISVRQKQPLGLGHAVLCAREAVGDEPFAVLLGDDLIDNDADPGIGQLMRVQAETGAAAIAIMEVPAGKEHMYGIVTGDLDASGRMRIRDMIEKPKPGTAPSRWAIVGRYVLPAAVWPHLAATRPGAGGEIQLTDALRELARSPDGMYGVVVAGTRHDAGDRLGYLRANLAYALKRPELRDAVLALCREMLGQG